MLTVHHTYIHTESRAERRAGEYVATLAGYQPGCMVPDNDMTRQYKVHPCCSQLPCATTTLPHAALCTPQLQIPDRAVIVLVGEAGAGKSSLANTIFHALHQRRSRAFVETFPTSGPIPAHVQPPTSQNPSLTPCPPTHTHTHTQRRLPRVLYTTLYKPHVARQGLCVRHSRLHLLQ